MNVSAFGGPSVNDDASGSLVGICKSARTLLEVSDRISGVIVSFTIFDIVDVAMSVALRPMIRIPLG